MSTDLPELMPMLRAYCDFYRVDPSDERLRALVAALIDDPAEGLQLIARDRDGTTVGIRDDLLDMADLVRRARRRAQRLVRDAGVSWHRAPVGRLIERCLELCRERGAEKLVWETAPDNVTAQRLYDGIGAEKSTWLTYELDA